MTRGRRKCEPTRTRRRFSRQLKMFGHAPLGHRATCAREAPRPRAGSAARGQSLFSRHFNRVRSWAFSVEKAHGEIDRVTARVVAAHGSKSLSPAGLGCEGLRLPDRQRALHSGRAQAAKPPVLSSQGPLEGPPATSRAAPAVRPSTPLDSPGRRWTEALLGRRCSTPGSCHERRHDFLRLFVQARAGR